eukprot:scaffold433_cov260-Chaetoceros_neogracile.AAC.37
MDGSNGMGRQRGELRYLAPGHHDSTRGFVVLNGSHLSSIGVLLCKSEWEWASMATVDGGLRTLAIRSMGLSLGKDQWNSQNQSMKYFLAKDTS